ncbi:MAG: hypothetical protein JXJ22_15665 [Bacteroidales bacterium]|nr:hypothetical protein [Bacteroidales bacterium]
MMKKTNSLISILIITIMLGLASFEVNAGTAAFINGNKYDGAKSNRPMKTKRHIELRSRKKSKIKINTVSKCVSYSLYVSKLADKRQKKVLKSRKHHKI